MISDGDALSIDNIILLAALDIKKSYAVYEQYKILLQDLKLSPEDYEDAINRLCAVLGL
jgi:hypothetical protein